MAALGPALTQRENGLSQVPARDRVELAAGWMYGVGMATRVNGIGGLFFRARDPDALVAWYRDKLGITHLTDVVWQQAAGPTVFAPFAADTEYFGRAEQQWMINFRVDDLDTMIKELSAAGIEVETREEWDSDIGRFARIHDPEGNPIELWQPPTEV